MGELGPKKSTLNQGDDILTGSRSLNLLKGPFDGVYVWDYISRFSGDAWGLNLYAIGAASWSMKVLVDPILYLGFSCNTADLMHREKRQV